MEAKEERGNEQEINLGKGPGCFVSSWVERVGLGAREVRGPRASLQQASRRWLRYLRKILGVCVGGFRGLVWVLVWDAWKLEEV